jgi:alkaline phosphatase D
MPNADHLNRRRFLAGASAVACWPFLNLPRSIAADRSVRLGDDPFQLGVASGEPTSDGIVLWTRLAPRPLEGGGMPHEDVSVDWQIAQDEGFTKIVQRGTATAPHDWAHAVHVEVEGLEPDRVYWYRFKTGSEISPVGRTRTAPAAGKVMDRFRFAFASCQHFESGLFTAYEHMAREDLHAVFHLGDYIYDGKGTPGKVRQHLGDEVHHLEDYRQRYAQYKCDHHLQAAHAAFPWVVTWDDHEVDNNYVSDHSEDADIALADFLQRRANAYKAYYEHMPLRRAQLPKGPHLPLYRNVNFGSLVQFSVLDTRQYRSDQPCGDRKQSPCDGVFDPKTTVLGNEQEDWLKQSLTGSRARWNVLAQQIMMGRVDRMPGEKVAWSMDQWSGYDVARTRLLKFFAEQKILNPVVITGDIHSNWVNDLKIDFDRPETPTVATEFVGTSITSGGDGAQTLKITPGVLAENPFVKFYNAERGYVRCDVTPDRWQSDYQTVEYVSRPGAPLMTRASFVLESGRPGAQRLS